jgi:hypothetical protein
MLVAVALNLYSYRESNLRRQLAGTNKKTKDPWINLTVKKRFLSSAGLLPGLRWTDPESMVGSINSAATTAGTRTGDEYL